MRSTTHQHHNSYNLHRNIKKQSSTNSPDTSKMSRLLISEPVDETYPTVTSYDSQRRQSQYTLHLAATSSWPSKHSCRNRDNNDNNSITNYPGNVSTSFARDRPPPKNLPRTMHELPDDSPDTEVLLLWRHCVSDRMALGGC
jgi:hypothetical protein